MRVPERADTRRLRGKSMMQKSGASQVITRYEYVPRSVLLLFRDSVETPIFAATLHRSPPGLLNTAL